MQYLTRDLTSRDGLRLFSRQYLPEDGPADRTVVIVHGLSEHSERYDHIAEYLSEARWNVVTWDHRGHGLSDGCRTHVESFANYLDDLDTVLESYNIDRRSAAILGHSLGGLITARYLETRHCDFAAVVLSCPLLGIALPVPLWKTALGRVLAQCWPTYRFRTNVKRNLLTRNEVMSERRRNDCRIVDSITARWFVESDRAVALANADVEKITCPVLAVQGGQDCVVDGTAVKSFIRKTRGPSELLWLPDHLHEPLSETDWPETMGRICGWLDRYFESPCPAPAGPEEAACA